MYDDHDSDDPVVVLLDLLCSSLLELIHHDRHGVVGAVLSRLDTLGKDESVSRRRSIHISALQLHEELALARREYARAIDVAREGIAATSPPEEEYFQFVGDLIHAQLLAKDVDGARATLISYCRDISAVERLRAAVHCPLGAYDRARVKGIPLDDQVQSAIRLLVDHHTAPGVFDTLAGGCETLEGTAMRAFLKLRDSMT